MDVLKRRAKDALAGFMWAALGRRQFARLGRFLWQRSRLDLPNDMATNGEERLVRAFAALAALDAAGETPRRTPVVMDVGANVGDWSAVLVDSLAAAGAPTPSLHAFEPVPEARRKLEQRLGSRSAGLAALEIRSEAVADAEGKATFNVVGDTAGRSSLVLLAGEVARAFVDVTVTSLDAYAESRGITRIDLLKIDTEGNDCRVLEGAVGLLSRRAIGWAQFEYNHRWIGYRRYLRDVFELVVPHGYSVGKITPLGIERYAAWHPELESYCEGNYLIWHGELPTTLPIVPWWMAAP
ncbi:MAG: FkbM family methyltransferase [Myxococcales bacterium]|nr:FkbM family methyltransferase [Myxococcales bacterium]